MKTKTKKTKTATRSFTPTQIRAKIVSALKALGYTTSSMCHEFGRSKAWLRKPTQGRRPHGKAAAAKVAAEIRKTGLSANPSTRKSWGGEWDVYGPQYRVTINQEGDTGNGGGAFVEVRKRVACLDSILEYEDVFALQGSSY